MITITGKVNGTQVKKFGTPEYQALVDTLETITYHGCETVHETMGVLMDGTPIPLEDPIVDPDEEDTNDCFVLIVPENQAKAVCVANGVDFVEDPSCTKMSL